MVPPINYCHVCLPTGLRCRSVEEVALGFLNIPWGARGMWEACCVAGRQAGRQAGSWAQVGVGAACACACALPGPRWRLAL